MAKDKTTKKASGARRPARPLKQPAAGKKSRSVTRAKVALELGGPIAKPVKGRDVAKLAAKIEATRPTWKATIACQTRSRAQPAIAFQTNGFETVVVRVDEKTGEVAPLFELPGWLRAAGDVVVLPGDRAAVIVVGAIVLGATRGGGFDLLDRLELDDPGAKITGAHRAMPTARGDALVLEGYHAVGEGDDEESVPTVAVVGVYDDVLALAGTLETPSHFELAADADRVVVGIFGDRPRELRAIADVRASVTPAQLAKRRKAHAHRATMQPVRSLAGASVTERPTAPAAWPEVSAETKRRAGAGGWVSARFGTRALVLGAPDNGSRAIAIADDTTHAIRDLGMRCVAMSYSMTPDGARLVLALTEGVRVIDTTTRRVVAAIDIPAMHAAVAGNHVVAAVNRGSETRLELHPLAGGPPRTISGLVVEAVSVLDDSIILTHTRGFRAETWAFALRGDDVRLLGYMRATTDAWLRDGCVCVEDRRGGNVQLLGLRELAARAFERESRPIDLVHALAGLAWKV
ncbi:MAG TPA: hypothetical protein VMJ10_28960 [Kofleriaceae bacterium]|nr:hypothetical protein [Kofleriaceae bacterium]